jgi:hypothetical protein
MEKISWADCVKNKKVLHTVKEEREEYRTCNKNEGRLTGLVNLA